MKKFFLSLLASVVMAGSLLVVAPAPQATAAVCSDSKIRTSSVWSDKAPAGNDEFRLAVVSRDCDGYDEILDVRYVLDRHGSTYCQNNGGLYWVQYFDMNANAIAGFNPADWQFECQTGKDSYILHHYPANPVYVHDWMDSSARCIAMSATVAVNWTTDWHGSTGSLCYNGL